MRTSPASLFNRLLFAAVSGSYAIGASATYIDGNKLLQQLQQPKGSAENLMAMGYIMGVSDQFERVQKEGSSSQSFCFVVPQAVLSGQLADITRLWLEKSPQHRHYSAAGLVDSALQEAYPCKK